MLTLDWGIIWTVVNILILFVLLRIFLFKPVMGMIENRQAMIRNQLDDAENKNREADELKGRYEESLKMRKRNLSRSSTMQRNGRRSSMHIL